MPHLLFVCSANRARSVLAELHARRLLLRYDAPSLTVASAGTEAVAGEPVWPPAMLAARGAGLDPSAHRSRPLAASLVAEADLVLTATRAQRDAVRARFADLPGVAGTASKVLTWRELEGVLEHVTPQWGDVPLEQRPALVPAFVAHYRGGLPTPTPTDLDALDPSGRGPQAMAAVARQTQDAVRLLVEALCRPAASADREVDGRDEEKVAGASPPRRNTHHLRRAPLPGSHW
ncbi:hypothetical protein [Lapillicoccus jejuensis]|uniref:Protein-tyrosine phosphatase n=1 Tax=Lapillicoccus jejuensis TaxID=402171 RepID=A0A542E3K1_9MICO|nr:hypothetical protein [Lapillicoccus jejuensis]TQJ09922.1 protein-tyrosine phosphatase [Lapillicoccus jejuensis]